MVKLQRVNAEYAQAANSRASAEGHRANIVKTQLETGTYDKVFPESDLSIMPNTR
ncbi:MAG: hypothetical protein U0Y68_20715 [Blastocatellia bacterium]